MSIQPSTWEERASVPSQAGGRPRRREVRHAEDEGDGERDDGGHDGRVEQRAGRAPQVLVAVAQDEDEARVGEAGEQAVDDAAPRVGPVRAVLERAGDEDDAEQGERQGGEDAATGRLVRTAQAAKGTTTTCRLPSTVASPAPTSAIASCQKIRSAAKKTPAITASRCWPEARGP